MPVKYIFIADGNSTLSGSADGDNDVRGRRLVNQRQQ